MSTDAMNTARPAAATSDHWSRCSSSHNEWLAERQVLVNGLPGVVISRHGRAVSIMASTIVESRIVEIDGIRDPEASGVWPATSSGPASDFRRVGA